MIFTTSWDDGYKMDLQVADLLEKYGCTGTFYVAPAQQHKIAMLTDAQIKELSDKHEIGAHTIHHPKLAKISVEEAKKEIEGSKKWVEERTGKQCTMFCYPYGSLNQDVRNLVEQAGYKGARTVQAFKHTYDDPFLMATSLQMYSFPFRKQFRKWWHILDPLGPLRAWHKQFPCKVPLDACTSWLHLAKHLFTNALQKNQPYFHLWGHSSELERFKQWNDLEEFLAFVAMHPEVEHKVNSGLL